MTESRRINRAPVVSEWTLDVISRGKSRNHGRLSRPGGPPHYGLSSLFAQIKAGVVAPGG